MKDKRNSLLEEDTEEMRKWRGMNEEEMDQCWKKVTERTEEEVLDKYKVEDRKRQAFTAEASRWSGGVCTEARNIEYESSLCSESTTCSVGKACVKIPRKKK